MGADRRNLLLTGAGAVAAGGVSGLGGGLLLRRDDVGAARRAVRLPRAASAARPVPAGAQIRVPGMTPFVTPNADFYRVDTALIVPQVVRRRLDAARSTAWSTASSSSTFDDLLRGRWSSATSR